jgi:hypothetical protein
MALDFYVVNPALGLPGSQELEQMTDADLASWSRESLRDMGIALDQRAAEIDGTCRQTEGEIEGLMYGLPGTRHGWKQAGSCGVVRRVARSQKRLAIMRSVLKKVDTQRERIFHRLRELERAVDAPTPRTKATDPTSLWVQGRQLLDGGSLPDARPCSGANEHRPDARSACGLAVYLGWTFLSNENKNA